MLKDTNFKVGIKIDNQTVKLNLTSNFLPYSMLHPKNLTNAMVVT